MHLQLKITPKIDEIRLESKRKKLEGVEGWRRWNYLHLHKKTKQNKHTWTYYTVEG